MSDPWTDIRKARVMIRTRLDPEALRFVYHPASVDMVKDALEKLGVREDELDLFKLHESEAIDLDEVLVVDEQKILETSPRLVTLPEAPAPNPLVDVVRDDTRRLLARSLLRETNR